MRRMDCNCMELLTVGWCTRKWLRLWWFENTTLGDSIGRNWIELNQGRVSPRPVWGKRGEGAVWFSVWAAPLDNWANGGHVDVFLTCVDHGFSPLESWFYSKELVWNFGTKGMLHCFRERRCQQGDTPGI